MTTELFETEGDVEVLGPGASLEFELSGMPPNDGEEVPAKDDEGPANAESVSVEKPDYRGVTTDDVLEGFVGGQRASNLRLGDILRGMGLVTEEQIVAALEAQKETRKRIGQLLIENGAVSELNLTRALARQSGHGYTISDVAALILESVRISPPLASRRP